MGCGDTDGQAVRRDRGRRQRSASSLRLEDINDISVFHVHLRTPQKQGIRETLAAPWAGAAVWAG